ncbi:MAG: divalent-cation tolerance protein CutA [Cohaesibacter sp.]|nr:divalent-cation tolerance protein CutA [Cohaesibacter sp.]
MSVAASDVIFLYGTCPDDAIARQIGASLVRLKLVACVNILPGMTSLYRWQGKVEETQEVVFIAKAKRQHYEEIARRFAKLHPYDEPALVVLGVETGLPGYLGWVMRSDQD